MKGLPGYGQSALDRPAASLLFREKFGCPPIRVARVPGWVEVLGHHADYHEGLVISAAVDRYLTVAASPRADGRIELVASGASRPESFGVHDIRGNPTAPWADPFKGMLLQLQRKKVHFSGFQAALHSPDGPGSALGHPAPPELAAAMIVRQLFPFSLNELGADLPPRRDARGGLPALPPRERLLLARLAQAARRDFAGVESSLLGFLSVLFGKAYHLLNIDCRFQTVDPAPLIGEVLVLCDSGVRHPPADATGPDLRTHGERAARVLRAKSLRSVELPYLKANQSRLTPREYACAYHVVGEIQRVVFAERALREDDHRQFGQYLFQSHESSRDLLQDSSPELDALVEIARAHPACLGARLTGEGFGGATLNLVSYHQAEEFMKHVAARYAERTGRQIKPAACQVVDGAG